MDANVGLNSGMLEQDRRIADVFARERARLTGFVRKRVPEPADVEDIVQDVFYELIEASRLLRPIEHLGGWLFGVARNRITDLFRRKRTQASTETADSDDGTSLESLLPDAGAGPEAAYARHLLLEAMDDALEELPRAQRDVFIGHEIDGRSVDEDYAARGFAGVVAWIFGRNMFGSANSQPDVIRSHDDSPSCPQAADSATGAGRPAVFADQRHEGDAA
jgi:RNA polymerase sigma factor (sigma-70 family)